MPRSTDHLRKASQTVSVEPAVVFAVAAEIASLPRWWFNRSPDSGIQFASSHVHAADGGPLQARQGAKFFVTTESTTAKLGGRRVTFEEASVWEFHSQVVEANRRLRYEHRETSRGTENGLRTTDIFISETASGTEIRLVQEITVVGGSPMATVARWVGKNHGDRLAARVLRRLASEIGQS